MAEVMKQPQPGAKSLLEIADSYDNEHPCTKSLVTSMRKSIGGSGSVGFPDAERATSSEIRLADSTLQVWKTLKLSKWERDYSNRTVTFITAVSYLQQYQPTIYSWPSIRRLRQELTLVFQDIPGHDAAPEFEWWDQPIYDLSKVSNMDEYLNSGRRNAAIQVREELAGYEKEIQGLVDKLLNHELSHGGPLASLSPRIHKAFLEISEVCTTSPL